MEFFWLRLWQPLEKKKERAFRFLWPLKPEAFPSDLGQRADRGQSHQTGAWAAAENRAIDPDSDFYWKQERARFRGLWSETPLRVLLSTQNKIGRGKAEVLDNLSFTPQVHRWTSAPQRGQIQFFSIACVNAGGCSPPIQIWLDSAVLEPSNTIRMASIFLGWRSPL